MADPITGAFVIGGAIISGIASLFGLGAQSSQQAAAERRYREQQRLRADIGRRLAAGLQSDAARVLQEHETRAQDFERQTSMRLDDISRLSGRRLYDMRRQTRMERGSAALAYAQSGVAISGSALRSLRAIQERGDMMAARIEQDAGIASSREARLGRINAQRLRERGRLQRARILDQAEIARISGQMPGTPPASGLPATIAGLGEVVEAGANIFNAVNSFRQPAPTPRRTRMPGSGYAPGHSGPLSF